MWINAKGFQKIMKKYDKHTRLRGTGHELGPLFDKRLEKEVQELAQELATFEPKSWRPHTPPRFCTHTFAPKASLCAHCSSKRVVARTFLAPNASVRAHLSSRSAGLSLH